jgi:hypothetical protein
VWFGSMRQDPAHVPYSHHGQKGAAQATVKRSDGSPIGMEAPRVDKSGVSTNITTPAYVATLESGPSYARYQMDFSPLFSTVAPFRCGLSVSSPSGVVGG